MPGTAPTILAAIGMLMMLSVFGAKHKTLARRAVIFLAGMILVVVGVGVEVVLFLAERS